MDRIWILGAADPEMELIEKLLRECGEEVRYATDEQGRRVHPGNAYRCPTPVVPEGATAYAVECIDVLPEVWVRIDHHRPGDPGYGRPPEDFMAASSIGQVLSVLRRHGPAFFDAGEWITCDGGEPRDVGGFVIGMPYADTVPHEMVLAAAADHCLAHAYAGRCPGVDPDDLLAWRIVSRAKFQNRSARDILLDVELARRALRDAPMAPCDYSLERWCERCGPHSMWCSRCYACACGWDESEPYYGFICTWVIDMRRAYTVTTTLVAPFAEGATVDSSGVGDSREVVFGDLEEGVWDEGGHHTVVQRGVPELPEAAAREGVAYLATVVERDGREKVVLGGAASPEMVREFIERWAPAQGLTDIYGDPARGFAGGYLSETGGAQ